MYDRHELNTIPYLFENQVLNGHNEISMSIHYAFQKRELYTPLAYKLGDERSSITEFKKVTMITIPINSHELFLISTEPRADYHRIIDYVHSVLDSQKDTE